MDHGPRKARSHAAPAGSGRDLRRPGGAARTKRVDVVIGVDTHKHSHTAAAVSANGAVLDHITVPADPKGHRRLIAFTEAHHGRLWAVEGTGSFGAGLTTALLDRRERVVEVDRPERPARRAGAKGDEIDALRAARQVLAGEGVSDPRRRGEREAIRVLLATRPQAVDFRTRAILALHALVTSAPQALRQRLRGPPLGQLLRTCAALRVSSRLSAEEAATVMALRATARRALACEREAAKLEEQLLQPRRPGAARPRRGRSRRRRPSHRQLNRALHTIVLVRRRPDPTTKAYVTRRLAEGKSLREIKRCLKRYVARQLFRELQALPEGLDRT